MTTTTKTIPTGTTVMDDYGTNYVYGGDAEHAGFQTVEFGIGRGGLPTLHCDPRTIAPAEAMPADLDKKDARIVVANDKAGRPGSWVGPWRAEVPGDKGPRWSRTKGEAVERAARRLAIRDWWAA
jgi:hypothetical protein